MIDSAKGRYKEVFKYATKGLLSSDPNKDPLENRSDFVLLFTTLYRRRLIQGYGCLYRMKFEETVSFDPDQLYLEIVEDLHSLENPIAFNCNFETLQNSIENDKNITFISRKSVAQLGAKDE